MIAYCKTATAAAWDALYAAHLSEEIDGERRPLPGVQIDTLGTVYHQTGTQTVDGVTVPVMTAQPGWLVNVIADEIPAALHPFLVNPVQPKRVYFGAQVLSMPEPLPETGGTAMVERGVGQVISDEIIARIERLILLGRISPEDGADKIALMNANLAVLDAREELQRQRNIRAAAIARMVVAGTARNEANAERAIQLALRTQAITDIGMMTGEARVDAIARRDAATAEATRLAKIVTDQNEALVAATAERDMATTDLVTITNKLVALRAARDALLP